MRMSSGKIVENLVIRVFGRFCCLTAVPEESPFFFCELEPILWYPEFIDQILGLEEVEFLFVPGHLA
jgi:hypothetical protein